MGTLLPYFMEDSDHAYVIMPGFYARRIREQLDATVQRTASDVLNLIEKIIALVPEVHGQAEGRRAAADVLKELLADDDYQEIEAELQVYRTLQYGEKFKNMYHPLICPCEPHSTSTAFPT